MASPSRFNLRASFRKNFVRLAFWAACSTALSYAVKSTPLWKHEVGVDGPSEDLQIKQKVGEISGDWWNSNASLASIEKLVSDYYGETPGSPIMTIDVSGAGQAFLPQVAESYCAPTAPISEPAAIKDPRALFRTQKPFASFFGDNNPHKYEEYYVHAGLSGYLPQSGVDLSADSFRLTTLAVVPEPASGLLLAATVAGWTLWRRRKLQTH